MPEQTDALRGMAKKQLAYVKSFKKEPKLKIKRIVKYTSVKNITELGDWEKEDSELATFLKKYPEDMCWITITIDENYRKALAERLSKQLLRVKT